MNQAFLVIGATLCYIGGFAIMILILGLLTELALEIWGEAYRKLCVAHKVSLSDAAEYGLHKKEFDEWRAEHDPHTDT